MKKSVVLSFFAGLVMSAPALAQQTPTQVGSIVKLETPPESVLVLRGNQTYALGLNDPVFEGDQIFTRTNGAVIVRAYDCDRGLGGESSLIVGSDFCTVALVTLDSNQVIGGVRVGIPAGIGATPALLGLLAAGGGIAAAGGGGGGAPASP